MSSNLWFVQQRIIILDSIDRRAIVVVSVIHLRVRLSVRPQYGPYSDCLLADVDCFPNGIFKLTTNESFSFHVSCVI